MIRVKRTKSKLFYVKICKIADLCLSLYSAFMEIEMNILQMVSKSQGSGGRQATCIDLIISLLPSRNSPWSKKLHSSYTFQEECLIFKTSRIYNFSIPIFNEGDLLSSNFQLFLMNVIQVLWAPIIDSLYFAKFGRRKSWLVPVQYLIGKKQTMKIVNLPLKQNVTQ